MRLKHSIDNSWLLRTSMIYLSNIIFFSIRFFKRNTKDLQRNIAVISLHKLGDTVFTIPAIKELIKNSNDCITIICFKDSEKIYRYTFNNINYLILGEEDFYFGGRIATKKARKLLQAILPDTILDIKGSILSASLIFNIKCHNIYGINEIYFNKIYDRFKKIRTTPHQIDIYIDSVKTMYPNIVCNSYEYPIDFKKNGKILIQPLAGWSAKEWGIFKFVRLYHKLSQINECSFIFPSNSLKLDVIKQFDAENINYISCDTINHLITEISKCNLFISNDSGPLQIAALVGVPTFTIYGPTNPEFHLPYGKFHQFIQKRLKCSPTSEKYCAENGGDSCPHLDCLELLSVDEVFKETVKFVKILEDHLFESRGIRND